MSIYSNISEQDLIHLRQLAEQQKNQRALENKIRILKQTHDIKLAENLSPITRNLDEVEESTEKVVTTIKKPKFENIVKALPISSKFSNSMPQMLESLMNSRNSLKITQDDETGRA